MNNNLNNFEKILNAICVVNDDGKIRILNPLGIICFFSLIPIFFIFGGVMCIVEDLFPQITWWK